MALNLGSDSKTASIEMPSSVKLPILMPSDLTPKLAYEFAHACSAFFHMKDIKAKDQVKKVTKHLHCKLYRLKSGGSGEALIYQIHGGYLQTLPEEGLGIGPAEETAWLKTEQPKVLEFLPRGH
ncbi:hypothetical protein C0995_014663 [Termitomyces sp. Mi166|nr:hypothetical protein C0995_014663 [Termitomyces sp. Mi166\